MRKFRFAFNILAIAVFSLVISSVAQAQATRTWVSGVGDDANPCSRTAPCKTFAGAISKTANGGEIDALDPAGYGAVTITKSITIDGGTGSGWASILATAGQTAVLINATANDVIQLRNLTINGLFPPASQAGKGVRFIAGKSLHIDSCTFYGFTSNGVEINTTGSSNVTVQNSTIRECAGSAISATAAVGQNTAVTVSRTQIDKSTTGISALANSVVTVDNSAISLCSSNGINTASGAQGSATDTVFANDGTGINIVAGATFRVNNNVFANCVTGVANNGTGVSPAANNKFIGNLTDRSGAAFVTTGSSVQ